MARVKGALHTRKRRKKILKLAKGFRGAKSKNFRVANQAVMKSLVYAYVGRKQKKRDFRRLWITRISAAAKMYELLNIHERTQKGGNRNQQKNAFGNCYCRSRSIYFAC